MNSLINVNDYFCNITTGYNLQPRFVHVESSTCDIAITWHPPYSDRDLLSGYQVIRSKYQALSPRIRGFTSSETVTVGKEMEYTTPCKLQPGRLYRTYIRSYFLLSNPEQEIWVDSKSYDTILGN
jgi:hypothetical protein